MRLWRRKPAKLGPKSAAPKLETVAFVPPEGVPIGLELASLGARFGAVLLDLFITWTTILLTILLIFWMGLLPENAFFSLIILMAFFAGVPYYVASELIWNGRTLGKRIVGIRVVSSNGRALRPHQIVARNLLKEAEFFAPVGLVFQAATMSYSMLIITLLWLGIVMVHLLRSKRKQRLGDVVAGTIVVVKPKAILLKDLARGAAIVGFTFDQAQLDIYGRYELQTLEQILRSDRRSPLAGDELKKVALTIARRIGYPGKSVEADAEAFLMAFYREQRERLESRQLFGERRDDKHHAAEAKSP